MCGEALQAYAFNCAGWLLLERRVRVRERVRGSAGRVPDGRDRRQLGHFIELRGCGSISDAGAGANGEKFNATRKAQ